MGITESEFNASLNNTISKYLTHGNHLTEKRAIKDAHHEEMMKLIDHLNEVKRAYKKLGHDYDMLDATCDAAFSIIKEHQAEIGITADDVNKRIDEFRSAKETQLRSQTTS